MDVKELITQIDERIHRLEKDEVGKDMMEKIKTKAKIVELKGIKSWIIAKENLEMEG